MSEAGCRHFQSYIKECGLDIITVVDAYFSSCISKDARKKKAINCSCFECGSFGLEIFACLQCIYFGCKGLHILDHLKLTKHCIAMELSHGVIYCHACKDFVIDKRYQEIQDEHRRLESADIKKNTFFMPWEPTLTEKKLLRYNSRRRSIKTNNTIGLRGLINLGSTCFMNCIVQALIHTPLLGNYFLSERHECTEKSFLKCLACEISGLFQEFYSGSCSPISLHRILHLIWNHAKHMAGYEQNDAHEFFIATLEILHLHCTSSQNEEKNKMFALNSNENCPNQCKCIIDQIFTGMLQSDVVCQACKNVSTTIDPFWDISLDLGEVQGGTSPKSLIDCLERYTQAEHLGPKAKTECSTCKSYQESTKQLSLRILPSVASFHLKRFERSGTFKKISSFISFPAEFDMQPFMSEKGNAYGDYRYSLYAVVNHEGTLDTGHYTAFVRHNKDTWVKCNDHIISTATLKQVLDSEGYLLFYHKNILEYE